MQAGFGAEDERGEDQGNLRERERGLEKTGMIFLSLKAVLLVKTQLISEELPHIYNSMRPRDQVCSRGIYFIICTILVFFFLAFFFFLAIFMVARKITMSRVNTLLYKKD